MVDHDAASVEGTPSYGSIVRSGDVVARDLGTSSILVHLASNNIFELNETGARIWALLDTCSTLAEISDRLAKEFDADATRIRESVDALVRRLASQGLVTLRP